MPAAQGENNHPPHVDTIRHNSGGALFMLRSTFLLHNVHPLLAWRAAGRAISDRPVRWRSDGRPPHAVRQLVTPPSSPSFTFVTFSAGLWFFAHENRRAAISILCGGTFNKSIALDRSSRAGL